MVIGIEADTFRILNDEGRPYLYPARLFEVVNPREPADWATEFGEDGERYAYPPPLNSNGFFEDFFEADKEAVATFWRVLNQLPIPGCLLRASGRIIPRLMLGWTPWQNNAPNWTRPSQRNESLVSLNALVHHAGF